ncbi:MAG: hypothetical protein R2867_39260 [Caldilineaceae bacterium]
MAGNGVTLTWAPAGPGWPPEGMDWYAATEGCQYLADDGLTVATTAAYLAFANGRGSGALDGAPPRE